MKTALRPVLERRRKDQNKEEGQQRPEKRGRIWKQLGVGTEKNGLFHISGLRLSFPFETCRVRGEYAGLILGEAEARAGDRLNSQVELAGHTRSDPKRREGR